MPNHLSSEKIRNLVKQARVVLENRFEKILKDHGVHASDSQDNDSLQGNFQPPISKLTSALNDITTSFQLLDDLQKVIKPHKKSAGDKNE